MFGELRFALNTPCLTLEGSAGAANITVEKLHISCRSDKFRPERNFIGFVLYQFQGKERWELNHIRCRSGYVFLQDTTNLVKVPGDTMHAKAYFKLFGEQPPKDRATLVASGFAYHDGTWKQNSSTFNDNETPFTKTKRRDGVTEFEFVRRALLNWSNKGCQNFDTAGLQLGQASDCNAL